MPFTTAYIARSPDADPARHRGVVETGLSTLHTVIVRDQEVTPFDVSRVVETAKAINISSDQRLLLVEPQEFVIDGQDVREPVGMSGMRLEVKVHIVTGAQSAAENIIKCVRRCGLEVEQLMLNPLASSQAVLTDDERELGVAVVDIGAGTTDVAIFTGGAIRHTAVIPAAGDLITSDIAMALRTPTKDAEEIKVEYGVAKQLLADPNQQLEVPGLGDRAPRMLSRQALAGVIEPRVEEIFSLVHQVIRDYMAALLEEEAAAGRLRPGVDTAEASDYLTRLILSYMGSPAGWDLTDEAQTRHLVRTQFLGGIAETAPS